MFVAVLFGVALIDFIVQNIRSVHIEFFSVNGDIPVAVALLAATLAGAFVVLGVGICRMTQLRIVLRRRTNGADLISKIDVEGDHGAITSLLDERRVM